jgi:hypothetical protein
MDLAENWVESFLEDSWDEPDSSESFKELNRSFTEKITHAGFINYLHLCWAREIGCELRPDMLYYTIISEVASEILSNPERYVHLFTGTQTKEIIQVISSDGEMKVENLIDAMRDVIKSPEFLSIICDVRFDSDRKHADLARKMVFANMGTPFYSYMVSLCGIPHVDLVGNLDDWKLLYSSVFKLSKFLSNKHQTYFSNVIKLINHIIYYGFDIDVDNSISTASRPNSSSTDFFNNIFDHGRNIICGSGHPDFVVYGWAKTFYINGNNKEPSLEHFSPHVNYVPYTVDGCDKYFCQAVTLAYSEFDEAKNMLSPCYGIITYEITNKSIYNKLANPTRTDQHGNKYQPLSLSQLKSIIDNGKLYDPAHTHYGRQTRVICDRCREYITIAWGEGKNHDLCLPCVEIIKEELSQK